MPVPVVFFHVGSMVKESRGDYLDKALRIAVAGGNEVILLGNKENNYYSQIPGVTHIDYNDYTDGKEDFFDTYVHMHPRDWDDFEKLVLLRYIVLRNVMTARNIETVFHADSDVAILANMSNEYERLGNPTCALSVPRDQPGYRMSVSGHVSFWTSGMLDKFIKFMKQCYVDQGLYSRLEEKKGWHEKNGKPGGVGEMTLLYLFNEQSPGIMALNDIHQGATYDHNINSSENLYKDEYQMMPVKELPGNHHIKRLFFRNNKAFGINLRTRCEVEFKVLHYQGGESKNLMLQLVV